MKKISLLFACLGLIFTVPKAVADDSWLIRGEQARDLRLLLSAKPEVEGGHFLLDTSLLNTSSSKSAAHARFYLKAPQDIASILSDFKKNHPDDFFLSKQSTVIVFSKTRVVQLPLYNASERELSSLVVAEGDIVVVGNFGDYL